MDVYAIPWDDWKGFDGEAGGRDRDKFSYLHVEFEILKTFTWIYSGSWIYEFGVQKKDSEV